MSPDMFKTTKKHHLSNTCPPPKKYSDFIQEDYIAATTSSLVDKKSIFDDIPSDSSVADDSDTDPLWKLNKNTSNDHDDIKSIISPTLSPKKSTQVLCSPSAKWTVSNDDDDDDNIIYEKHENGDSLRVKRVLFQENSEPKKSKIFQKGSNTSTKNSFNIESF
ncbi:uncharacterized protein LOC132926337 [Rhopalosiphum padi]|uniref:uncharacterized protein LOC132926337 n=1 Tax=Rhopalosiphum padi TaxID=40932 RepID=UPI00298E09A1|nr:uncharacterized protein LOC132926337 [Rhopalosiphum padi]